MGRAIARTCKRAWSGAARPAFIVALLVLVPVCVVLIHSVLRAQPNTIIVNTTVDDSTSGDGLCSLRKAITNADDETDTTGGDCVAGTGTDTINFSVGGTFTLTSALPLVLNNLTIDGVGQTVTIDGASAYQILYVYSTATVALNDLTIAHAGAFYGAIDNDFASLTVTNSTFSDNLGYYYGGAICQFGGSLTINNSTFAGNEAEQYYGGAIDINGGTATVTNSTFSDNTAAFDGGAIASFATLTVTNSTFSGNSSEYSGGGIYSGATTATVSNSILAANTAGNCSNTIVGGDDIIDGGYNISSDTTCGFSGTGANHDTIGDGVNPSLAADGLQNNGGPTDTIYLQASSPAIAAIPSGLCPATDQRGARRPAPGQTACDIGAVEDNSNIFTGIVTGGTTGISGSTVTLYAAGGSGYGSGATSLGTTTSAGDGSFTMTFSVPVGNPQTYITATGGDAGQGPNSAIGLMAALGPFNGLSEATTVTINELTTAAAEWSLTQFLDPTGRILGVPAANPLALPNAYIGFANLADINPTNLSVSGNPSTFLPSGASCFPGPDPNCDALARLNTLSNVLAGCVESDPSSTACAQLLCDATPGDSYGSSCTTPVPSITDTLGAAYSIVANPNNNVGALVALASVGSPPFSPYYGFLPDAWEMALNFNNNNSPGAAFFFPYSLALDASGNVFVANEGAESVSELTTASNYYANDFSFAPANAIFNDPWSIAVDRSGNVFVTNFGNYSVSELTAASSYLSGSNFNNSNTGNPGASFSEPVAIALDASGNVFVANESGNTVSELLEPNYTTGLNFNNTNSPGAAFANPVSLALDESGNVFAANLGSSVTELTAPDYTTSLNFNDINTPGAAFAVTPSLALDASSNIFVADAAYMDDGVSELTAANDYGTGYNFDPPSAAIDNPSCWR
jgi:predicted outer membrane repeat protein